MVRVTARENARSLREIAESPMASRIGCPPGLETARGECRYTRPPGTLSQRGARLHRRGRPRKPVRQDQALELERGLRTVQSGGGEVQIPATSPATHGAMEEAGYDERGNRSRHFQDSCCDDLGPSDSNMCTPDPVEGRGGSGVSAGGAHHGTPTCNAIPMRFALWRSAARLPLTLKNPECDRRSAIEPAHLRDADSRLLCSPTEERALARPWQRDPESREQGSEAAVVDGSWHQMIPTMGAPQR